MDIIIIFKLLDLGNNTTGSITISASLFLGSDIDRINNNNNNLRVHNRVSATSSGLDIYAIESNDVATTIIIKSGEFGIDTFNKYEPNVEECAYAGIYVGGLGSNYGSFYGDRILVVEGGKIANIIGGLKIQSYLIAKTYIYVKSGDIINIVGGAGVSTTYGDRIIQVTGGLVEHSVSGGSNGAWAGNSSSSNANGELIGNTLVYIGGNATIGSRTSKLYYVEPGTVSGAGNGAEEQTSSGKVYTSHVIIDGEATINGNIYGGGNYGFVEKGNQQPATTVPDDAQITVEEVPFSSLVSGNKYMIVDNSNYTMYYDDRNSRPGFQRNIPTEPTDEYLWTIEKESNDEFYIKYNNRYLNKPSGTSNYFRTTTSKSSAGKFKYDSSSSIIQYTNSNSSSTAYLRRNYDRNSYNYLLYYTTSTNQAAKFKFYEVKIILPENPDLPEEKEFEVDCIDILGGTIKNNVYGGSNRNKIAGNVDINMSGGTVEGTIYGGSNDRGNIEGNVDISIEGGNVGKTKSQDAIFGGGYGSSTTIQENVNIAIQDKSENINILGNIYGGSCLGNISGKTEINIEDHYSANYTNSISGIVFGGGKGSSTVTPTSTKDVTVNVNGGIYEALDIYGGYNIKGNIGTRNNNAKIAVNIGEDYETTVNDVYGGGNKADISNTNSSVIVRMKNAIVNNAYNGGNEAGITGTQERAIYSIGATINNLFGGSNNSGALETTKVIVSDKSKIGNVFGGGNKAPINSNTKVEVTDSKITENLYGGGNRADVGGFTDVDIKNSAIMGDAKDIEDSTMGKVYGGGNAGQVTGKDTYGNSTVVNISDNCKINTVYGGGCSAPIINNSNVEINNSTIKNVFGGGEGEEATVNGNTSLNIEMSESSNPDTEMKILENVYGGGDLGKVEGRTNVTITKADIGKSVFGGGNRANIDGNTSLTLTTATSQNVYGGGMEGQVRKCNSYDIR